jgi:hypothetical protein
MHYYQQYPRRKRSRGVSLAAWCLDAIGPTHTYGDGGVCMHRHSARCVVVCSVPKSAVLGSNSIAMLVYIDSWGLFARCADLMHPNNCGVGWGGGAAGEPTDRHVVMLHAHKRLARPPIFLLITIYVPRVCMWYIRTACRTCRTVHSDHYPKKV